MPSSNSPNAHATELPDSVRIPLDSLWADSGYLIGRVIADSSCGPMVVKTMRGRLDQIKTAWHSQAESNNEYVKLANAQLAKVMDENQRLLAQVEGMRSCLEAYEQLEADLILENACWEGREVPQFTGDLWDRAIEIQAQRNKALGRFSVSSTEGKAP